MTTKNVGLEMYVATSGSALLLVLADLLANLDAATTLKLGAIVTKYIGTIPLIGGGGFGILVVLLISAFLCWLKMPTDKGAAFTLGFSVFAVLGVASPYSRVNQNVGGTEPTVVEKSDEQPAAEVKALLLDFVIPKAIAQDVGTAPSCAAGTLEANATLAVQKNVSSCRPYYSGIFGLSSFINNSIEYCHSGHVLPAGTAVQLLKSWETSIRSYRYSEIRYQQEGLLCTGWVSDGRKQVRAVMTR